MNSVSDPGVRSPRRAMSLAALAACIPLALALAGCDNTTPPAPTTTTVTAPPQTSTGGSGGSGEGSGGSGGGVTPTRSGKPTAPPKSSEYNPKNCPTGLVC